MIEESDKYENKSKLTNGNETIKPKSILITLPQHETQANRTHHTIHLTEHQPHTHKNTEQAPTTHTSTNPHKIIKKPLQRLTSTTTHFNTPHPQTTNTKDAPRTHNINPQLTHASRTHTEGKTKNQDDDGTGENSEKNHWEGGRKNTYTDNDEHSQGLLHAEINHDTKTPNTEFTTRSCGRDDTYSHGHGTSITST